VLLSPGIVVASASERAVQRLKYTYTYDLFLPSTSTSISSSSNQLEYQGFFDLAPRATLLVGAAALQSNVASSILLAAPGVGAVGALPSGSSDFLAVTANELLSFDLAPRWRAYEGAAVTEQTPIFGSVSPQTFAPGARVGIERSFMRDAAGLEARVDYSVVDGSVDADGVALGEQRQIITTGMAVWRHDWGRLFTTRVAAGALQLQRLNTDRGFWEPAGSAALVYATPVAVATLAYAHTVTTNPLLGQTLLIDELSLRGAVPLTKNGKVLIAVSAGYQSGQILDENADPAAHVDALIADAGIGWQIAPSVLLGLRYQHIQQISDTRVPTLPLSFVRNAIMLGTTIRFPPEADMPGAYRAPQRVDGTDEIREAVEPAESAVPARPGGSVP
jgi:hypothetical protein